MTESMSATISIRNAKAKELIREIQYRVPLTHEYMERLLDAALSEERRLTVERAKEAAHAGDCTTLTGDWCADEDHIDRLHAALRMLDEIGGAR